MQYKETGMSGFSVKRVNVVGAFASLWAFIFAFFPFYSTYTAGREAG